MSMKFAGRDFKKNPLTRADTQIKFDPVEDKSLTQQHHNDGGRLDTTAIMSQFFKTGVIVHTRDASARYIDATHFQDFQSAMSVKARADQAFEALPEEIRLDMFDNSQEEFVKFCLDEKNLDKMRELGLANPLKGQPAPVKVIIENPVPPAVPPAVPPVT